MIRLALSSVAPSKSGGLGVVSVEKVQIPRVGFHVAALVSRRPTEPHSSKRRTLLKKRRILVNRLTPRTKLRDQRSLMIQINNSDFPGISAESDLWQDSQGQNEKDQSDNRPKASVCLKRSLGSAWSSLPQEGTIGPMGDPYTTETAHKAVAELVRATIGDVPDLRTIGAAVAQYGRYWPDLANGMPRWVRRGEMGWCHRNARRAAIKRPEEIRYVEGFARATGTSLGRGAPLMAHAWLVNDKDEVIDPTWDDGADYVGVVIPASTLHAFREMGRRKRRFLSFVTSFEGRTLLREFRVSVEEAVSGVSPGLLPYGAIAEQTRLLQT